MKEKKSFSGWRDHLFQIYHILDSSDSFYNMSPAKRIGENIRIILFTLHIKLFQLKTFFSQFFLY